MKRKKIVKNEKFKILKKKKKNNKKNKQKKQTNKQQCFEIWWTGWPARALRPSFYHSQERLCFYYSPFGNSRPIRIAPRKKAEAFRITLTLVCLQMAEAVFEQVVQNKQRQIE